MASTAELRGGLARARATLTDREARLSELQERRRVLSAQSVLGSEVRGDLSELQTEIDNTNREIGLLKDACDRLPIEIEAAEMAAREAELSAAKERVAELRRKARREATDLGKHVKAAAEDLERLRQLHLAGTDDAVLFGMSFGVFRLSDAAIDAYIRGKLRVGWTSPSARGTDIVDLLSL